MEQSSTGRSSSYTEASLSEKGDTDSVDKVASNNQEESLYSSEGLDDQSRGETKELYPTESEYGSRDDDYAGDEDDRSTVDSPTTGGGSVTHTAEGGSTTHTTDAGDSVENAGAAADGPQSIASYGDDFADDDSASPFRNPSPPPDNPVNAGKSGADSGGPPVEQLARGPVEGFTVADAAAGVAITPSPPLNGSEGKGLEIDKNASDDGGGEHGDRTSPDVPDAIGSGRVEGSDGPSPTQLSAGTTSNDYADGIRIFDDGPSSPREGRSSSDSFPTLSATVLEEKLLAGTSENQKLRESIDGGAGGAEQSSGNKELAVLRNQVEAARAVIVSSLGEKDDKPGRSLLELVLLVESRHQQEQENRTASDEGSGRAPSAAAAAATAVNTESVARTELEKRVELLERDLECAKQESRAQSGRAASLQQQLDSGGGRNSGSSGGGGGHSGVDGYDAEEVASFDIMALKAKAIQLVERLRQEKTARLKAEREMQKVAGKVQVLSDHIEKLMLFLKHEATQKAKAHEQQRRLQKELDLVKARSTALMRSNQAKDRVTIELREGSKILEDQLRLMDEKYMELRTKLDWTRTKADKDVRRARAQASALRTKWALLCTAGGGGENTLLDSINIDPTRQNRQSSSAPEVGSAGDYGHYGSSVKLASHNKQQQHQHHGGGPSRGGVSRGSPPIGNKGGLDSRVGRGGAMSGGGAVSRGGAGALASSTSEPLFARQHGQQRQKAGGGSGGGLGGARREGADGQQRPRTGAVGGRSGLLQGGVKFNPGLSAGSDPGGGSDMLGGVRGGSGGGQRPPWSEQGGKAAGGRHAPQLLYA